MLAHLSLFSPVEEVSSALGITPPRAYQPQYNIAPSGRSVVEYRLGECGGSFCDQMRWGLKSRHPSQREDHWFVPGDVLDERFPEALNHCRCLAPVNGFFLFAPPSAARKDDRHRAFYFRLREEPVICLAGIREDDRGIDPEKSEWSDRYMTFAIMGTYSNDASIHVSPRMPVVLRGEQCSRWLWDDLSESEIREICRPLGAGLLEVHEVSDRVLDVNENDASLIEAIITDET